MDCRNILPTDTLGGQNPYTYLSELIRFSRSPVDQHILAESGLFPPLFTLQHIHVVHANAFYTFFSPLCRITKSLDCKILDALPDTSSLFVTHFTNNKNMVGQLCTLVQFKVLPLVILLCCSYTLLSHIFYLDRGIIFKFGPSDLAVK